MGKKDPRIDAYIAAAAPFARPILKRLRKAVHAGCPGVVETLKWRSPSFEHHGILCGMAAFQAHCVFGFWKHALLERELASLGKDASSAMGSFGRIAGLADLPGDAVLVELVRKAAALNEAGVKVPRPSRARPAQVRTLEIPRGLLAALGKNRKARATFEGFSYSHKKEYVEWITEAKREETRRRRLEAAVAMMAEGKERNWKYARKGSAPPRP